MRLLLLAFVTVLFACQSKGDDGKKAAPAPAPTEPTTGESPNNTAIERLRAALLSRYSHRDRLGLDWSAEIDKHRAELDAAATPAEFAFATVKVLRAARDIHISVSAGPAAKPIPTHDGKLAFNFSMERTFPRIKDLEHHDDCIASGFVDGVGYLLLKSFLRQKCARFPSTLLAAWKRVSTAKAMIVDARPNTGGDELLARQVAARFVDADVTYATHANGPPPPSGESPRHRRRLMAAMPRQRFGGPVALLIGPGNLSSAEAFVLMMMKAPRVTVIGEKTYGSSGNPQPISLGNGVTVNLPSWRAFTPEGEPLEGVGIAPAQVVAWGTEGDPVLDAALAAIKK